MARQRRRATVLSEGDAEVLRRLIDQAKKLEVGKPPISVVSQVDDTLSRNFQASEVYIALIPEDGIPGVSITLGVGTGTKAIGGSGTGSSPAIGDGDRVSSAFCDIYEILLGSDGFASEDKELVYRGFAEKVYNLSRSTIPTGYAIIQRDKWGQFVVTPGGVSSRHKAVITQLGGILPEEQGEVQIWRGRPTAPVDGLFEQAWLDWLYVDDGLPEGQRIYIEKFEGDEEYTITVPWC